MPTEKLSFENAEGQTLAALLELPEEGKPKDYGIFAHCFTCNKNYKAVRNISRVMSESGVAMMGFDFTGLGESEGEFSETNFSSNVDDMVQAARFLSGSYGNPTILIGHSLGGAAVLHAAGEIESILAVVTISTPAEPMHLRQSLDSQVKHIEETGHAHVTIGGVQLTLKKQFFDDLEKTRLQETIANLGKPLLILHSPQDRTVPIEDAELLFAAARHPKSFISLEGADHLVSDKEISAYAGRLIAAWARRYLGV